MTTPDDDEADACLLALLGKLASLDYRFITPTPATHRHYLALDPGRRARDLRDIFGWSLPFDEGSAPDEIVDLLWNSGMMESADGLLRSRLRVSTVGGDLFLHSAYPPNTPGAVFFGPDTYRFARFLAAELGSVPVRHLIDIGAGSGAGAISAARRLPGARITLIDTNPFALKLARINARHAGVEVDTLRGSGLGALTAPFDLAIANPPFMAGSTNRPYRDGGAMLGAALSLVWADSAAGRLMPGGRMLLYTGSAIVAGEDLLEAELRARLQAHGCTMRYSEIDPDIFGGQLDQPGYELVERIAAIGAVITKPG